MRNAQNGLRLSAVPGGATSRGELRARRSEELYGWHRPLARVNNLNSEVPLSTVSDQRHKQAGDCAVPRRTGLTLRTIAACLCGLALMAGCAPLSRRPVPPAGYTSVRVPGFPPQIRWDGEMTVQQFRRWAATHLAGVERSAGGNPVNILVLSGGGGAGAFAAGVLSGWSQLGTRPPFQIVTGVSVGALIAPFAFLGPHWDKELSVAFLSPKAPRLLDRRMFGWFGALFGWSLFHGAPLRQLVDEYATPRLLRAVAAQTARGRLLLVATTNLDTGEIVVWNMGAIAAQGGPRALWLFRKVLVASASIPGDFPPVLMPVEAGGRLFDEMQVDGSASSSFLFAPGVVTILPGRIQLLDHANVYLVINGHLRERRITTRNSTPEILVRSADTVLVSDSRSRVKLVDAFAERQGANLKVTEIPASYPLGGFMADLEPAAMQALFAYGERCAREHEVWGTALTVLNRISYVHRDAHKQPPSCPVSAAPH